MIRLIQKIKESLVNHNTINGKCRLPSFIGDPSLRNVSPEVLDELAEMVDRRRAELLAEQCNNNTDLM